MADILALILGKENVRGSYRKLEGIERSKLTDFLMSQIICKSNSSGKLEMISSERKDYILMNNSSIHPEPGISRFWDEIMSL